MKVAYCVLFLVVALLCASGGAVAQRDPGSGRQERNRAPRLEKFRKMLLVEELNLGEEEAVRFSAKQNAHESSIHKLMEERNDLLDQIDSRVKGKVSDQDYRSTSEKVLDLDKRIFDERRRYQEELRGFLTPEQFARFLVFERKFGRQVRNAIEELHQKHPDGGNE
jgi:hypothetical protein